MREKNEGNKGNLLEDEKKLLVLNWKVGVCVCVHLGELDIFIKARDKYKDRKKKHSKGEFRGDS